jgi:AcrR family transcriptional regulator
MTGATRTYTKVARAAAQERTRSALLDAACESFFAGRWDHVSLEAIADDAGVTKQTLLRHFGSKQGLLEQAYAREFERVREQRLSAPSDDVPGAIDNLLDHYDKHGERALKLGQEAGGAATGFAARARELHYEWVEHAFAGALADTGGAERARLRAALIVACDVQAWWILSRDLQLAREDVRTTLIMTIRRLLGGDR